MTPNHEYPAYLKVQVTVTDSSGLTGTDEIRIDPATLEVEVTSDPVGVDILVGEHSASTPFTTTVVEGATLSMIAPQEATIDGVGHVFDSWTDGAPRVRDVTFTEPGTYQADYVPG